MQLTGCGWKTPPGRRGHQNENDVIGASTHIGATNAGPPRLSFRPAHWGKGTRYASRRQTCAHTPHRPLAPHAADETFDVSFTASNFTSKFGQPAVDPVSGSFQITLDPTKTYLNETAGITLTTLNLALSSPLAFDFSAAGTTDSLPGQLVVGGSNDGACCVAFDPPTNDFWLQISSFFATPTFGQVGYSQSSTGSESLFFTDAANGGTGTITASLVTGGNGCGPVTGVPEPSTWAMMLLGFAGLGYASFRRASKITLA